MLGFYDMGKAMPIKLDNMGNVLYMNIIILSVYLLSGPCIMDERNRAVQT